MRLRPAVYVIIAVLFVLLGVVLTHWLNERFVPRESTAADSGESQEVTADVVSLRPPPTATQPSWEWPASGELIREEDLARLPAEIQELVADPGWNQPYIPPPAERTADRSPLGVAVVVDAPLSIDGTKYRPGPASVSSDGCCDLSMHAEIIPDDSGYEPQISGSLWAFRDGTVQFKYEGGAAEVLSTTHRYTPAADHDSVFIVRVLVVDDQGGRSFADSLPIEFSTD